MAMNRESQVAPIRISLTVDEAQDIADLEPTRSPVVYRLIQQVRSQIQMQQGVQEGEPAGEVEDRIERCAWVTLPHDVSGGMCQIRLTLMEAAMLSVSLGCLEANHVLAHELRLKLNECLNGEIARP